MLRIGICDDDRIILDYVYDKIKLISAELGKEVSVEKFLNGSEVLSRKNDDIKPFDILFLDIDMPLVTGFEVAEIIRESNQRTIIIFLTSMDHLVYESFKYRPFRFIRKERLDEELVEVISSAINIIEKSVVHKCVFSTDMGEVMIPIRDILYFESINRRVYLHTEDSEYVLKGTQFSHVVNEFAPKSFILIHRTCLVNLKYIFSIGKIDITLDNGTRLPMSRYKVQDVKKAFTLYAE